MKIAIAHDWLNQMGGAENVLEQMVALYPGAPVFTTIYGPELMPDTYRRWTIKSTWLNRAPGVNRHHQPYLPLYPPAVSSMDFSGYDVILSNKSGFIHGLRHTSRQLHICYCLAPTRYVWDYDGYAQREGFGRWLGLAIAPAIKKLQQWDFRAAQPTPNGQTKRPAAGRAQGVDHFIAISKDIQTRIKTYYGRDSVIIYPPVDTGRFRPAEGEPQGDYYLIVSRLIPYKRIDLAVQALSRLKRRLIIVGDGRDRAQLEQLAGPTVEFKGRLPWDDVAKLMANCRAFLFPGFEDFGIAPVEAQAAGRPVIAFAKGGALDTVIEPETGLFFREQTVECLMAAVEQFETMAFDPVSARANAERFSNQRFKQQLSQFIGEKWQAFER
ncbi:MAG: glycosyltransferase [Anaerolineaceae bacterium]|nr:glycosyltransferase [Anaerolineaceae bacterium]MCB9099393.1 glycosyltransferase [Anaerolineales bacterium]